MVRRGSIVLLSLILLMSVAAGPATAAGGPAPVAVGTTRDEPIPSLRALAIRGSDGSPVYVYAEPAFRKLPAQVRVAFRESGGTVTYSARGNLSGERIKANFGRFGRVDLRWRPSGAVARVPIVCRHGHGRIFIDEGVYVGTVAVRGGGGFSTATAHRVSWRTGRYAAPGCPFSINEGFPGPGAILSSGPAAEGSEAPLFEAIQNGPGKAVEFWASQSEEVGHVTVDRVASVSGGHRTLRYDPGFRTAAVTPPQPFQGAASFERTEHARGSWLGDLSVEFPDGTSAELAGPRFEAIFHSGFREVRQFRTSARPSRGAHALASPAWPSTKPWPTASATSSPPAPG
jgi:hypothetical protein